MYLSLTTKKEKDLYYSKHLHKPFTLLAEGVLSNKRFSGNPRRVLNEMVQDLVIHFYLKLSCYDPSKGAKPHAYFSTLGFHKAIGILSSIKQDTQPLDDIDVKEEPIQLSYDEDKLDLINKSLKVLEEYELILFNFYFKEELSIGDIALKIGIPESFVHRVLTSCRKKIKEHLGLELVFHKMYSTRAIRDRKPHTDGPKTFPEVINKILTNDKQ